MFNNNNNQGETRNIVIAMFLFIIIMFGYNYFFEQKQHAAELKEDKKSEISQEEKTAPIPEKKTTASEALSSGMRVSLESQKIKGSIDLKGSLIDNITLKNYKETIESNSKNVDILTPKGTDSAYYYSIFYNDKTNNEKLDESTVWTKEDSETTKQSVVVKTRTNSGLVVERTITFDDGYLINVTDKVINVSDKELQISKKAELIRCNPKTNNYAVVHEGIIGNFDGKVKEIKYSDVETSVSLEKCQWFGYTDIYWLCSLINKDKNSKISYSKVDENTFACSIFSTSDVKIAPNSAIEFNYGLFAGPKDLRVLRGYSEILNLDKFDMAIDFGWFFMLTKPLLHLLDILAGWFNNMGFVILLLTLLFKLLTYPLTKKSFKSAAKMRDVQPKVAALQKLYAHDKMRMNQELMALYKREKVSPMSGCLPMLLQAPIFFCLYKVFFISMEMRHAPLFGWVKDLSAPDPLYIFNLFGAIDWTPPSILRIGIWPLIMGATMFLQQKLSSATSSKGVEKTSEAKMQENMMLIMPVLFTYICASFPVGVVIYWTISNVFSIAQQYYANTHTSKLRK